MSNISKALITFVVWATIALTFHHFVSNKIFDNCFVETKSTQLILANIELPKIIVTEINNDTIFVFNESISIVKNTDSIFFTSDNSSVTDSIKNYLSNNYDKNLTITGTFSSKENLEDLGFKRAEFLKNMFITSNINPDRIEIYQIEKTEIFKENNTTNNGIKLAFKNRNQLLVDSLETNISNKILHLNFTDNFKIIDSLQLNEYIPYLKRYSKKYPTSEITITGHTDNDGFYQNNLVKGLNWANTTRDFLMNKGLNTIPIITNSKGEAEPIANKYTEEGKAKNRRIEIKIIK